MAEDTARPIPDLCIDVAHPARIWNVWQGGKDNFEPDRDAARSVAAAMPSVRVIARLARRFQADAVRQLLDRGVRQFLDIGTSLPVAGSVHQIAQREAPESRVVYVDNDPLVLTHARVLLTSSPQGACDYIDADLREPGKILAGGGPDTGPVPARRRAAHRRPALHPRQRRPLGHHRPPHRRHPRRPLPGHRPRRQRHQAR